MLNELNYDLSGEIPCFYIQKIVQIIWMRFPVHEPQSIREWENTYAKKRKQADYVIIFLFGQTVWANMR